MFQDQVLIGVLDDRVEVPAEAGVTKVGGVPHWICAEPSEFSACNCPHCGSKLGLLVSADCPVSSGYDRVIFLFICPRCGKEARAWRQKKISPLEDEDIIPIPKAPEPVKEKNTNDLLAALDAFNMAPTPTQTTNKQQKKGKKKPKVQYETGAFPAYYVSIFDEPEAMLDPDRPVIISGSADSTGSDMAEEDGAEVDPILVEFNERISRVPNQVLRYSRGSEPLLQDPLEIVAPPCPCCGAPRVFEFEVIPTVIYMLAPDSEELDFGPILVYTCANDCGEGTFTEHCVICPP